MEDLQRLHLLASTDELDRLIDDTAYRECSTTTRVTIELGEDHTIEVESLVKLGCGIDRILTSHGVNDEECLIRSDRLLDATDLIHHLLIDGQTTCGIDDDGV